MATTPSPTAYGDLIATIHVDLAARNPLPSEHYQDIGHVAADMLVAIQADHEISVIGPAITGSARLIHAQWNHLV